MVPRRFLAALLLLALTLPAATASNHGGGGTPTPGNDCGAGRDATSGNPIRLSNGIWCEAELPTHDPDDWFTFTANVGDTITFVGQDINLEVSFCIHYPTSWRGYFCSDSFTMDADDGGTWKVEVTTWGWGSGDDYRLKVTVAPNPTPAATSLLCSPNPIAVGASAVCQVRAVDDDDVRWFIDWGDGTTTETGWVPAGYHTLSHTWSTVGTHTLRATPTDDDGAVGNTVTSSQVVQVNRPPSVQALTCGPAKPAPGQTVTCSFIVRDDSDGVSATVDWGDGSTPSLLPSAGTVRPGGTFTATHAFATHGHRTVTVIASDNGGLGSNPATAGVPVLLNRVDSGWIVAGHPATRAWLRLDDSLGRDPESGWDSIWVPLVGQVHSVQLDWRATVPADVNVQFYLEDGRGRATAPTDLRCARVTISVTEACDTPPDARWAVVTAALGADIDFTLTQWYS